MSEKIILYVTRTGHCRTLALELGILLKSPVFEIVDTSNRKGILRYIMAGGQATRKAESPIVDPMVDLAGVKIVILVQPVWASNLCPPLRTWLNTHRSELTGIQLALVTSQLGLPSDSFKLNVEKEFGPLLAYTSIQQKLSPEEKIALLKTFIAKNL